MSNQMRRLYEFGRYRLDVERRLLTNEDEVVTLAPKTFDLLVLLVQSGGRLLGKRELMEALWPDTFVEEANIVFQVSTLRKALGEHADWIETVPKHGYRFTPDVAEIRTTQADPPASEKRRVVHTTPLAIAAVALLLLLAVGVGWKYTARVAPPHLELVRLTSDAGLTTEPAISPDGRLLAYASDRSGRGDFDIWVRPITGGDPVRITDHEGDDHEPVFSPDGTRIAFRSERNEGGIYITSFLGGQQKLLARGGRRPRFSPDGMWIAYWMGWKGDRHFAGRGTSKIFVVPTAGGAPRDLRPDFAAARYPVWSPDGRSLLFAGARDAAPGLSSPSDGDWYVTPLEEGGVAVETGAFRTFGRERLMPALHDVQIAPSQWLQDYVLFAAQSADSTNLWQIPLAERTHKVAGSPERLTLGTGLEVAPAVAAIQGETPTPLVFASLSSNMDIWSLPLPPGQLQASTEPVRLTDNPAADYVSWLTPDGKTLGFLTSRSGAYQLWTKDLESGREAALDATPEARGGVLNADGSLIAYPVGAATTRKSLYAVSLTGGIADRLCDDCGAYSHVSSDRRYVSSVRPGSHTSIEVLDRESGKRTVIVADDRFNVYVPRFSPDDRWLEFHARASPDRTQIFVVPFAGGTPVQRPQWIAVTAGEAWEDAIAWSVDGNRLYFVSERDGYRCIYAQDLDAATKHPLGKAFTVFHSHHTRLSLLNLTWGYGQNLAASRDRMVFGQGELTGNIWLTRRVIRQ